MLTSDNFCQSLGGIPEEARIPILKGLQMIWKNFRENRHPLLHGDHICVLSKMIVWLTMGQEILDGVEEDHEKFVKFLFGGTKAEFKHFWNDHWECSPFLMEESETGSEVRARLLRTWRAEGDSFVMRELLTRSLACPPFSSDALEATQIYNEIEKILGKPPIFGQDIRLVKSVCANASTEHCSMHAAQELDYHKLGLGANIASSSKDIFMYADVQTCVGAYESGYTLALRGLEFRCSQISAMAEALAVCFGQATVGANLYMTPSNSQGFKPHHDDHCVLVWQLTGCKAWKLWAPKFLLPRLYSQEEKLENFCTDEDGGCRVLLKEGSLLYLPRGFPHAASTKSQAQTQVTEMPLKSCLQCTQTRTKTPLDYGNGNTVSLVSRVHAESGVCSDRQDHAWSLPTLPLLDCHSCIKKWEDSQWTIEKDTVPSLHITFGVEVEAPFDWEGFTHMSLHCWAEDQNWEDILGGGWACEISSKRLSDLYKGLMHVAVRQCGDKSNVFRKACLVAAQPLCKEIHNTDRFHLFFKILLQNVAQTAAFKEALDMVLTAMDTSASTSLEWMRWLRHLPGKHQARDWMDPVVFFHNRLTSNSSLAEGLEAMEVKFTKAKKSFVSCASFSQACDVFIGLLHKYRSVRKRFTNGMLALQT